jgi:hypothetical protein
MPRMSKNRDRHIPRGTAVFTGLLPLLLLWTALLAFPRAQSQSPTQSNSQNEPNPQANSAAVLPRGKKLCLKGGTFQLVRSYERKGDRVRYYSVERAAWEEIPEAMVDWDATKKAEAESAKEQEALREKVRAQEAAERIMPLDIDASLEIARGVFLPPGEGVFVLEGDFVRPLEQVGAQIKLDKKRLVEQILVPVPVVPARHRVQIPGPRAALRITTAQPEFYLREAPPDPDRVSPIEKSSRPGMSGPEVELIRATVKGGSRQIEILSTNVVGQQSSRRDTIALQRWEVAKGVYRLTLGQSLAPGEYALAEILPEGLNLFVWEFGVDKAAVGTGNGKTKQATVNSTPAKTSKP